MEINLNIMSTKRKSAPGKKGRGKSKKVEYDEEDISSESDLEDVDAGSNVDAEDAIEEDLTDVSNIPELRAPEVNCGIAILL